MGTTSVLTLKIFRSRRDSGAIHLRGSLAGTPVLYMGSSSLRRSIAKPKSATLTRWLSVSLKKKNGLFGREG